jgi:hypothetical protein
MSSTTDKDTPPIALSLQEVGALLVRHYGLRDGLWDVAIELQAAIGQFGLPPNDVLPGAMFRISRIGLSKAAQVGPLTVNAAEINPLAAAAT